VLNLGLVIAGASVGAPLRYVVDRSMRALYSGSVPLGTLTVNLAASMLLGLVAGLAAGGSASPHLQLLVGTGFCGTLSTYSAFSYETLRLGEERGSAGAIAYTGVTVAGGIVAAFAGFWLA